MMHKKYPILKQEGGEVNLPAWLDRLVILRKGRDSTAVRQAAALAQVTGFSQATPLGESCLHQGLVMADHLAELGLDDESIIAGLLFAVVHYAQVSLDDVEEQFGAGVRKLIKGTEQMDAIHISHGRLMQSALLTSSIDNLRKMLLAMVDDVRVVLIKLVERLAVLRHIAILGDRERRRVAQETMDIYAPLANRLGVGQLKWQLEDFAFRYLEPDRYQRISESLQMRREERENFVKEVRAELELALAEEGITHYDLSGRAKHIYSIARKMERKRVSINEIYDVTALRLLVPTVEDCYKILSAVHARWHHIPKEFDDYISKPKLNGYRSIHTAIIGPGDRHVEIQIRTYDMHQESELGVAAHWMYKESGKSATAGYDAKIAWLRHLIEWQKEIVEVGEQEQEAYTHIFDDRIYVFTPNGDVLDFPKGSTPLDFAYHIHTDIGHRCRGAKVNGLMVPLNYQLQMGDKVEVLTGKEPHPSRDWLLASRGYLMTSRAKAKVHHWFRILDFDKNKIEEEEIHVVPHVVHEKKRKPKITPKKSRIEIMGVSNLLTHLAGCCRPENGDPIIGYVTLGHGVRIHRRDCVNITDRTSINPDRLIEVKWGK